MFDRIEKGLYWDRLWRLVDGCTPCSPGCERCWSARYTHRFDGTYLGHTFTSLGEFNGLIRFNNENLDLPRRTRKPQSWLVLNDLFHEDVPDYFIKEALQVMRGENRHVYFLLTKRSKRMAEFFIRTRERISPNIWLGVTVCNQQEADEKIPLLLQIPAAVRWVSVEPMLGPMEIIDKPWWDWRYSYDFYPKGFIKKPIDWIILGGESGPGARPMHPDWARSVRDQCQAAGLPFFFKQWGRTPYPANSDIFAWMNAGFDPYCKSKNGGRELDGREYSELPKGVK